MRRGPSMAAFPASALLAGHRIAAESERAVTRAVFRTPPRLDALEWAERYRYLSAEASPGLPGRYRSAQAPYQREPQVVASDPRVRRIVLMWASQLGKSTVIENIIGRTIHLRPRPILVVHPKIEFAEGWSKKRLAPMVRDTPALARLVSEAKSRTSSNTLRMKTFPNGFLSVASANSPAELAADAVALLLADEVDRFEESAGSEGDPIDLAERRLATIADSLVILTSTPGEKGESRIEPAYEAGDQRRYLVPCPHCGHEQELLFGAPTFPFGLKWDRDKPETAEYLCEHCACLIPERQKRGMIEQGRWCAQRPDHRYPSFTLNALYSLFPGTTWTVIVRKFLEAKGRPMRLKTFVNTMLAETWEDSGERVEAHELIGRLEKFPAEVPDDILVLTAGVDVQDSYLEVWVWGWGREQTSAPIHWEQIPGDPGTPAPWAALDAIRQRTWTKANGTELRIACGFVDSGHHTARVYAWCRPRQKARWFACKGVGGEGVALVGKPTFQGTARVMLIGVGVFAAKEQFLRSQLHVRAEGPEYVRLPDWLTLEHLQGLTSEKLVKRIEKGRKVREWIKTRDRNEPLDCRNYAFAALHHLPLRWLQKMGIVRTATPPRPASAARPPITPVAPLERSEPPAPSPAPAPTNVAPTNDPSEDAEIAPPRPRRRRQRWNPRGF